MENMHMERCLPPLVIQFSSVTQSYPTLCDPMNRSTPGLPVHHQPPVFTQTHVHRVGDAISHFILCRPLLFLPPIPPSIRVFSNESILCIRWPKYWSFSFSISASNEHSGLISFRMDWLDLLAVQGTLKSLLQHHSSKASIFIRKVQLKPQCDNTTHLLDWSKKKILHNWQYQHWKDEEQLKLSCNAGRNAKCYNHSGH